MTNEQRRNAARIMRGAGQVPFRPALRISIGEALTNKAAHFSTLIWGIAYGIISMSWTRPAERPIVFVGCLAIAAAFGYGSTFPWRWRLAPRGSPWYFIYPLNGGLALMMGLTIFFVAVSFIKVLTIGSDAFTQRSILNTMWGSLYGFQFPVIGFYVTYGIDQAHRGNIERLQKAWYENVAEQARLIALRSQINPHFFFNALNTIAALIPQRPDDAERAVELLATSLRPVLTREQAMVASLQDELRVAHAYAEIEQLRFGPRCRFLYAVADVAMQCVMPSLTLQPLLENAVRHGAAKYAGQYEISLSAELKDNVLIVTIRNAPDGFNLIPDSFTHVDFPHDHALHNISQRLRILFGREASLVVARSGECAGVVNLLVPQSRGEAAR